MASRPSCDTASPSGPSPPHSCTYNPAMGLPEFGSARAIFHTALARVAATKTLAPSALTATPFGYGMLSSTQRTLPSGARRYRRPLGSDKLVRPESVNQTLPSPSTARSLRPRKFSPLYVLHSRVGAPSSRSSPWR